VTFRYLLDASALLALIQEEPGADVIEPILESSCIHTLNLAEVLTKLFQNRVPDPAKLIQSLQIHALEDFSTSHASACAALHAATRGHGLSLGDCVCLSRAEQECLIAVTTERMWRTAVAGRDIEVLCIR
jgi:ribonuclease VapC